MKGFKADTYINAAGGKELYQKEDFAQQGIALQFIDAQLPEYKQTAKSFVPGLSILDVLMHNSKDAVLDMLLKYKLS